MSQLLMLFALAATQRQLGDSPIILDGTGDRYAAQFVFVAAGEGVYAFNRSSETWSRFTSASGLPDNRVNVLGLDDGILWVGTPRGLASADIRINDWQTYELPGAIHGLTFDKSYVWAGGDSGLRRFDKFAETWELIADRPVNDLNAEKGFIWLATDSGVLRYNPEFEKLEPVPAPAHAYQYAFSTPRRIWFLGREGCAACGRDNEQWSSYPGLDLQGLSAAGDSLLAVVDGGVRLYEPAADNWVAFREVENLAGVNGVSARGDSIAFATLRGLLVFGTRDRSTRYYDRNTGLEHDSLRAVYDNGAYVYAVSAHDIAWRNRADGTWKFEKRVVAAPGREQLFSLDDAGAHFRPGRDWDLRLAGRAYYSDSRAWFGSRATAGAYDDIALNLAAAHRSGRTLSLYYNDTDKSDTAFGLGYRGIERDGLDRVNAGKLKTDYFRFDLLPQFSILGGNARLRYRAQRLDVQAGQTRSQRRSDFFTGRVAEQATTRRDIDFSRGQFYGIPVPVAGGADTVFVDDRNAATDGPGTRPGYTVGGRTGDFDPLLNGIDYYLDPARGIVQFRMPRRATDVIVLVLDGTAIELQSDTVTDRGRLNVYSVGPKIIPGSLALTIRDSLEVVHPLAEFGLDADADGQVDAGFLDCDLGYLTFPGVRPFPDVVYDSALSVFSLEFRFRTEITMYYLSEHPVERGSEEITVDGEVLARGTDYVIDYTSGALVFLREDIVADFSEIAVHYASVERRDRELLGSVQPVFAITPGLELAPGYTRIGEQDVVHLSGRAETGSDSARALRYVPQVAFSGPRAWSQDHVLTARYRMLNARAEYQGGTDEFDARGAATGKYGDLRHAAGLAAGVEPIAGLRLDGNFRREYQDDSLAARRMVQNLSGKLGFQRPQLPYGYILAGQDQLPDYYKLRLKANAGWELIAAKSRLRLDGIVQYSVIPQSAAHGKQCSEGIAALHKSAVDWILTSGFVLPIPVQGNVQYRRNRMDGGQPPGAAPTGTDDLRARLGFDLVPGLYYTGIGNLKSVRYGSDLRLDNEYHNALQVAPGRWLPALSLVNFSFTLGTNFDEYLRNLPDDYRAPFFAVQPVTAASVSHVTQTNSWSGTVQVNPRADLMLRARHALSRSGDASYGLPVLRPAQENEVRVEYEPGKWGLVTTIWNRRATSGYPGRLSNSGYLEWNRPWTEVLRTRLITSLRFDEDRYGATRVAGREYKATAGFNFQFNARSFLNLDLGGAQRQSGAGTTYAVLPGAGLNVNLFRFLYIQVDYQSELPLPGTATHQLTTKLTAQF